MANTPHNENPRPQAIPVRRETLRKARIELQDLPAAKRAEGAWDTEPESQDAPELVDGKVEEVATESLPHAQEPAQRESTQRTPAFQQPEPKKESSINRKALESTNRGVSPKSRRFVRGILHPSPSKVILAAIFAILVRLTLVAAVVLMVLIVFDRVETSLVWWILAFPAVAVFHLIFVGQVRCRVCGQKEFVKSGAHKHVKTHHLLFLGPIISTGLHVLLFKWFHCMFCGTAVRIKK
jgi:hypothetical protein